MSRRGPIPGTIGRDPAEVARIARNAHADGQRMAVVIAGHYRISERAATAAISRARAAGHDIPSDLGWSQIGPPPVTIGAASIFPSTRNSTQGMTREEYMRRAANADRPLTEPTEVRPHLSDAARIMRGSFR